MSANWSKSQDILITTIEYLESVVKRDIPKLSPPIKSFIKKVIEEKLVLDSIRFGKSLQYNLKGCRQLKVGYYRTVYKIESDLNDIVTIKIQHRKDVYQ